MGKDIVKWDPSLENTKETGCLYVIIWASKLIRLNQGFTPCIVTVTRKWETYVVHYVIF